MCETKSSIKYYFSALLNPIIAGIIAGLVAGLILTHYQNKNDTNKVIKNLRIEIAKNLPLLNNYLDDVKNYKGKKHNPQNIYI